MMVQSFLAWMDEAAIPERLEAVQIFAQAYLAGALGAEAPEAIEAAFALVLDDPAPPVRRALALALADCADLPRAIVLSLAGDQPEVSALLIARSPLLTEADLFDLALHADNLALVAIALRREVTARVAAALISRQNADVARMLARNPGAELGEAELADILAHHAKSPRIREAILARPHLPASIRHRLLRAVSNDLGDYAVLGGFLPAARQVRLQEESLTAATLAIAQESGDGLAGFIAYLRAAECLTPALLLRSLLGGDLRFLSFSLSELTGLAPRRVHGLLHARSAANLSALLRRAGLPDFLEAPMVAAIRACCDLPEPGQANGFSLPVIRAAQSACLQAQSEAGIRLLALLRRYETEAARAHSRQLAAQLREEVRREVIEADALLALEAPAHGAIQGPESLETDGDQAAPNAEWAMIGSKIVGSGSQDWQPLPVVLDKPSLPEIAPLPVAEKAPDLKTLIAQWRAEASGQAGEADKPEQGPYETWSLRLVA